MRDKLESAPRRLTIGRAMSPSSSSVAATLFLLLVGLASCQCKTTDGNLKLELVQVLFRHGERTPQKDELKWIPDATSKYAEPWGFAQLTNKGKMQEYNIGKLLRRLYGEFLGDEYRPEHVFATSSYYDRTKASLELVLAGLYPPTDDLLWNEDLKWMPIPIHFVPWQIDALFNLKSCPKFDHLWQGVLNSAEVKKIASKYEGLYKYLRRYYPNKKFNVEQLFFLNNILTFEIAKNRSLPEWYTPAVHDQMKEGAVFYLQTLSYNPALSRLNGGSLARRFLENMNIRNETKKNPRKIYLYSGHEYTVYAVAKAHNIMLNNSPTYSSALILEKLRDEQGKLYVKMNYWTGTTEELQVLNLPGCGDVCPIEKYLEVVQPSLPTDDEMRCLYENLKPTDLEKILNTDKTDISE